VIGTLHARLDGRVVSSREAHDADPRRTNPVPRGLYETILVLRDRPLLVAEHAARLAASSATLGLGPVDPASLCEELVATARRAAGRRARLRVLRWEDGAAERQMLTLDPEPPPPRTIVIGVSPHRRPADLAARRTKRIDAPDLDRVRRDAAREGVFDHLVLDTTGRVLEGAKTSVFWRTGAVFSTPAAELPLLPGIRRAWLSRAIRRAGFELREVEADLSEVISAEELIVTNAMQGAQRGATLRTGRGSGIRGRENDGPHVAG
jgi:para-aminobenzoate synthetase/4-amino-4-deoxychorismate lyase